MSSKMQQNLMMTTVVALMLVLGGVFGYVMLGGHASDSAGASVPTDTVMCTLCTGAVQQGGGGTTTPLIAPSDRSGGGGNR